ERIFRPRARRTLEICSRYHVPTGTLLEVGAGFGTFCEEIRAGSAFERIIAVEPTPDLAETCRARGLEVIATPIEEVSLPAGSVDVVASFEVLEHLFSPQRFVEDCSKLLAPGGLLIVTCPNIRGFDLVTLGPLSETIDVEHLNYFHPASLRLLFERCGLEVLEVQTPGQLDAELVRKKALAGEIDLSSQPFLQQILLDEWERAGATFQSFLADNLLSSHMWVIGRKPYS
ncbi:MAG: methyltransferase domain-containing protein, partial [Anaerolineae bacterium]|nr:methyltransferase domain-containing protein [Anaerolineae bacterium]